MKTFKPNLETLEDRLALDGYAGTHLLYQDVVVPAVPDYSTVSGKVTAIAVDESDHSGNTYYIGAANGGVWKTTDGDTELLDAAMAEQPVAAAPANRIDVLIKAPG